jgi:deazaflavin-dependent oxidoreductase (nitroreductase family)
MRRIFRLLNKFFMVPIFRLGFGPLFGNPFTGYIMVLKPVGRKSGRIRFTPVNYAIYRGNIYCVSGGGKSSDWYLNLLARPEVEVILPAGAVYVHTQEVFDPDERRILIRAILKNAGFAGFFEGYNPWKIGDEALAQKSAGLPLLRFHPAGIANGASDPGGWTWIAMTVLTLLLILWILFP